MPAQLLALQLLPHLDELAAQRRTTLSTTVARALAVLRADFPEWEVDEPAGGSVLWPRLPIADTSPYVVLASRHGVHVAPGSIATRRSPQPAPADLRRPAVGGGPGGLPSLAAGLE